MNDGRSATPRPRRGDPALWGPVVACMAAMYYGATVPTVPASVTSWLSDAMLHAGGYTVLALLTLRATSNARWHGVTPRALLLAFVIAVAHGLSVEWIQMYVPTRMAEWRDVGNDVVGTAAGLGGAWAWSIMRGKSA